jgi:uncharacterized membrane protein
MNDDNFDRIEKNINQALSFYAILIQIIDERKKEIKKLWCIIAILFILVLVLIFGFVYFIFNSEIAIEDTSQSGYEITQSVDGENSSINNVKGNQYNDDAKHYENTDDFVEDESVVSEYVGEPDDKSNEYTD